MPNAMSEESRRVNFIWDKDAYAALEEKAATMRVSAGELIRRALEEKYSDIPVEHPVTNIRVTARHSSQPLKAAPKATRRAQTHRSGESRKRKLRATPLTR